MVRFTFRQLHPVILTWAQISLLWNENRKHGNVSWTNLVIFNWKKEKEERNSSSTTRIKQWTLLPTKKKPKSLALSTFASVPMTHVLIHPSVFWKKVKKKRHSVGTQRDDYVQPPGLSHRRCCCGWNVFEHIEIKWTDCSGLRIMRRNMWGRIEIRLHLCFFFFTFCIITWCWVKSCLHNGHLLQYLCG